ncbi:MAG: HisA/HisF-related TIM barrel protein, partial [Geminicoccaceae bacterium]
MIIPSIDLQDGNAVQLIGGEEKALDAGDPRPLATRYGRVGEIAVIDLDAALGSGDNRSTIEDLIRMTPCRVGGGIRSVDAAIEWLDKGAKKVILGTAARPDILKQLPPERVIVALDAKHGEVVVEGWQKSTGRGVIERINELQGLADNFMVTFVEREGRLGGTDLDFAKEIKEAAGDADVTIAGGVTSADEVAELDRIECDAQIGMALYTGKLDLAEAFTAPLKSDRPDGLWSAVVTDERGVALGFCFSDLASITTALDRGAGIYHSRSRGLWVKGESSGATQELIRIAADCDRDCLR